MKKALKLFETKKKLKMNWFSNVLCVYLINCVYQESPELKECPYNCTCFNAPSPISFNDDHDDNDLTNGNRSN